jgi:hypothetical protein
MRKEKALRKLLSNLVAVIAEESDRNPEFAARLDQLLAGLPERGPVKERSVKPPAQPMPDLYAELQARGEHEFRLWLRDLAPGVLRASIRTLDLDPTRRTARWKEAEKIADFIADGLQARSTRGSGFLRRRSGP